MRGSFFVARFAINQGGKGVLMRFILIAAVMVIFSQNASAVDCLWLKNQAKDRIDWAKWHAKDFDEWFQMAVDAIPPDAVLSQKASAARKARESRLEEANTIAGVYSAFCINK